MKIYFAGSIRGGRADAVLYQKAIAHIKEKHTVLTEQVGDLSRSLLEQKRDADALIYEQDMAWLRQCDAVIAECTCPSLGVGYELAAAEHLGKPVHIFYRPADTSLSAMLKGNRYFSIHPYSSEEELLELIDQTLFTVQISD